MQPRDPILVKEDVVMSENPSSEEGNPDIEIDNPDEPEVLAAGEVQAAFAALDEASTTQYDEFNDSKYERTPLEPVLTIPDSLELTHRNLLQNLYHHLSNKSAVLREHQVTALNQYCNGFMKGQPHAVFPMTMGSGKSVIAAFLLKYMLRDRTGKTIGKALITTSKNNLVEQIIEELLTYCPELKIAKYKEKNWQTADIVVTTDAAIKRAKVQELSQHFCIVLVDEAHKSLGEEGARVVREFILGKCIVIPLTATPINDIKLLSQSGGVRSCYELIGIDSKKNSVKPFNIVIAEELEILAPVRSAIIKPVLDSDAQIALEDQYEEMHDEQLGKYLNREPLNRLVAHLYANGSDPVTGKRYVGKQAMVFAAGINHAEDLAGEINRHIKVSDHDFLQRVRENYVNQASLRAMKANIAFNKHQARDSFRVAMAIHAGKYSVNLDQAGIAKALQDNQIKFKNPRTDREEVYILTQKDRNLLLTKQSKQAPAKIDVLPKLKKAEKQHILNMIADGGVLVAIGADMLIEGANFPNIGILINARGTQSLVLEGQRCGRVLRKSHGKVANIIEFALPLPRQVFFYDITGGKMALGKQDQSPVIEDLPTFTIPGCAPASELAWNYNELIASINANSKRVSRGKKIPAAAKRVRNVDQVVERMTQVINALAPKLEILENQLNETVGFVRERQPSKPATTVQLSSNRARPAAAEAAPEIAEEPQSLDHAHLKSVNRHAAELIERLNSIIEGINNLDDEIQDPGDTKRRRGNPEPNAPAARIADRNKNKNVEDLRNTLQQLNTLRSKIDSLTKANMTNHALHDVADKTSVMPRDEKENDVADLLDDVMRASGLLEEAQNSVGFGRLQEHLQQLAIARAERAAQREREIMEQTLMENCLGLEPLVELGDSEQSTVSVEKLPTYAASPDPLELATRLFNSTLPDFEEQVEEGLELLSADFEVPDNAIKAFTSALRKNNVSVVQKYLNQYPSLYNLDIVTQKENYTQDTGTAYIKVHVVHYAVHHGQLNMARLLVEGGSILPVQADNYVFTNLILNDSSPEDFEFVIKNVYAKFYPIDYFRTINTTIVNRSKDDSLISLLMLSAQRSNLDYCRILLQNGADPLLQIKGKTCLDFASQTFRPYLEQLISDVKIKKLMVETKNTLFPRTHSSTLSVVRSNPDEEHAVASFEKAIQENLLSVTPADYIKLFKPQLLNDFQTICGAVPVPAAAQQPSFVTPMHVLTQPPETFNPPPVKPVATPTTSHKRATTKKEIITPEIEADILDFRKAIHSENIDVIKTIIQKYPSWLNCIPKRAKNYSTNLLPLLVAFKAGKFKSIKILLELGANPKEQLEEHCPFTILITHKKIDWRLQHKDLDELITLLINQYGYNLNTVAVHRYDNKAVLYEVLPLFVAVENTNGNAFKLLLEKGANPDAVLDGQSCLDSAPTTAFREILVNTIQQVRQAAANQPLVDNYHPLMFKPAPKPAAAQTPPVLRPGQRL